MAGIDTGSAEEGFCDSFFPPPWAAQSVGVWPAGSAVLGSAYVGPSSILTGYSCSLLVAPMVGLMPKYCALVLSLAHSSDVLVILSCPLLEVRLVFYHYLLHCGGHLSFQ